MKSVVLVRYNELLEKMRIGLAFPEIDEHNVEHFLGVLDRRYNKLDLIVFPEGFETIYTVDKKEPGKIKEGKEIKKLIKKYFEISSRFKVAVILGMQVYYGKDSISGGKSDQYCLLIDHTGKKNIYHKHSTSKFNAFFDNDWSIKTNFPVVQINKTRVGISVCHDSYISLIPKVLSKKRADIWVNISYQNVRPHIWESILQTRAVENSIMAICTLHRNNRESNPQKEPYAFSTSGKIKLKDLETDRYISDILIEERTGRIFYFDISDHEIYPIKQIKKSKLAPKAKKIAISLQESGNFKVRGNKGRYSIEKIDLEEFIFSPEKLWKISLERKNKIPLFFVIVDDNKLWEKYKSKITKIIKGRIIEFSTFFLFIDKEYRNIFMAAYRSSNYKDCRVFHPREFPIEIDKRYLYGLKKTYDISLNDSRKRSKDTYFERVNQMINFLQNKAHKQLQKQL